MSPFAQPKDTKRKIEIVPLFANKSNVCVIYKHSEWDEQIQQCLTLADDSSLFSMVTVMVANSNVGTEHQPSFIARALHIIKPDRTSSSTKKGKWGSYCTCNECGYSQKQANNIYIRCICYVGHSMSNQHKKNPNPHRFEQKLVLTALWPLLSQKRSIFF